MAALAKDNERLMADASGVRSRSRFTPIFEWMIAAAFLLDNPDEVAVLSMRKVAERASVQPAGMVRLAQYLGFPGWNELREIFVGRLRKCSVLDFKFTALGHNTVRGAAGAAVLNAELMQSEGWLDR